jgi:hypothetical protein
MCCQLPLIAPIIHSYYGIFAAHAIIVEDVTNEEVLVIDPAEGRLLSKKLRESGTSVIIWQ